MSRHVTFISWDDAVHISKEAKESLYSAYAPNEREARTKGVPSLGAGAIYPVPEDDILEDPMELPPWYKFAFGMDVGWNRTAAIWGALDPESDILHLYSEYYRGQAEPAIHAAAILSRGKWIPGVIDPASSGSSQRDGEQLLTTYQNLGLNTLTKANNAVEPGIYEVWGRLSTGRLKVFRTLQNFRQEYRIYRRDEKGKICKENDHLCDSLRYLVMSGIERALPQPYERFSRIPGLLGPVGKNVRHQYDFDPMAEARNVIPLTPKGRR